jgi:hypothetical protein
MFKALTASAAVAMVLAGAGVAQATTLVSNFTQDSSSHGLGVAAPYGQVVVNDAGGTLAFTVTLFDGLKFGSQGSTDSFAFNLGNLSPTISDITDNGRQGSFGSSGSTGSSFGDFKIALDCSNCSHDYDSDAPSVLSFKVSKNGTALTVADLTKNSSGEYFAANVINSHDLSANIGANSLKAAVPEPATWLIMLLGFSGLGAALRYRRQQGVAFARA